MKKILVFISLCVLPYLSNAKVNGYYRVTLESVEAAAVSGTIANNVGADKFTYPSYADEDIAISFSFQPTHIDFTLHNKTNSNIRIIWDEAIYVGGPSGVSDGVFHSGVRFIEREKAQTPSVIMKGSNLTDMIVLKSGVSFSMNLGRWVYSYILWWENQLKDIKLMLPIEKGGEVVEYLFDFSVEWEKVKVKTRLLNGKEFYFKMK